MFDDDLSFSFGKWSIRDAPIHCDAVLVQKTGCFGKMTAAEEAGVGRKWTWVGGCQNKMARIGQEGLFCPGVCSPEEKDDGLISLVELPDYCVGKRLPSDVAVRIRLSCANGQNVIQKEDAVFCPCFQTAMLRRLHAQIVLQLLKDILEGGAAAVRYLRMSGAQDGSITFRCGVKSGELRMLLQDTCSDFSELRSRDSVGTYLKLDTTGEVLPLKRMGYELLEQAVENSDGSCLLENGNPGVRLLIRLPLSSEKPRLADEPAYRASNDSSGRASLMNIILADLL